MIFEKYPSADISASIVWINMLPEDSLEAAAPSINVLNDKRCRHFYDPNQIVGKSIAELVGWSSQVAWDIYLFFEPGAVWQDTPPEPRYWMHQLKDQWADAENYYTGNELEIELFRSMENLQEKFPTH